MSANRPFGRRLGPDELSGRTGIVAIADVHGNFEAFDAAIDAALAAGRFVVQLGDLVDRGPYSPLCVERMLDLETEGKGLFVPGNHEVALAQYLADGTGGAVTRQASLLQFEEHGGGLLDRFVERIRTGPLWIEAVGHLFVHAAFHPAMLTGRFPEGLDVGAVAVHGYGTSAERRSGRMARTWADAIPAGLTVVVGHAVTASRTVETVEGRLGGRAVFADTGSWLDPAMPAGTYDIAFR
jgi:hypothetical protein